MRNEQPTILDLIIESHVGLNRQGIGSAKATIKALSYLDDLDKISKVLDLGCGSGGQTMTLAQKIPGDITGVDICPELIEVFNKNAKELGVSDRVKGIVSSMDNLNFEKDSFDLIWSEGAIYEIGFARGLKQWNKYLKKGGFIAVTDASWLTNERPQEIEKFWNDAGCGLNTIEDNISIMQKSGFNLIATFLLPAECWTDNYFTPRNAADKVLLEKYSGNEIVENYIKDNKYEEELYSKYNQYYGYVFYIGKKIK